MSTRKEYEMLFQLNAQLGSSYNSTFTKAQQQLVSMQKEIQSLSKTQSDISAYQKQQGAVDATQKKLEVLRQQYDNIQKEMQETGGCSSDLQNKLLSKQQQIDKTTASLERQKQELQHMDAALREAGVDTGNLTGESAKLGEKIKDLEDKEKEAADGAGQFGESSVGAISAVQDALAAAGIAAALHEIYEAYMECVSIAGSFEEGMSNVEAISGASAEEMELLSEKAKELGATTKFTAQEASDAMGYMAMAGWDAADMLNGMDGVMSLAAASGEDLATVSDIVTDNLTAFGLTASDTAHFADVLAAAATNSNTNVSIMGETFKMSASIAGALGYSVEDVAVAVGLMANSGIKGSVAGTALKNTFNGLLEGVTLTSDAFGEYTYTAINADGTMKDFSSTIDELRVYFSQMTEAERVNNAMAISGQRGYNGLLAILNATDADYQSLSNSISDCSGAAQKMAGIKLDNMNGQLTIMKSAWDGLKISIGEQFTPAMSNLYEIMTEVLDSVRGFVEEHPAMVKAVATFVAVLGAIVAGLTAFVAVTKVVIPLMGLLTASIPGVNIAVGIAALTAAIVGLVSAANEGVPSVKSLTEAAEDMRDTMDDARQSYEETASSTIAAANVADTYISKLEEMGDYASLSTDEQRQYHNTLVLLCQVVPDLANSIDLETNSITGGTEALRANTEAWKQNAMQQAYQEQLTAMYSSYSAVLIEAEENSIGLTQAQYELDAAQQKLNDTYTRMNELYADAQKQADDFYSQYGYYADASNFLTQEYYDLQNSIYGTNDEIWKAEKSIKNYNKAIAEDEDAVAAASEEIALAEEAVRNLTGAVDDGSESSDALARQQEALGTAINGVMEQVNALSEAYSEAYSTAYESISGQYSLWEKADTVVATSAENINGALSSQASYWADYNANLEALAGRTGDIKGLSEVIASFADGSTDSVNAIAGMATASDEDLSSMVENWRKVQEEQKAASDSIAELKTNFTEQMDLLQSELADDINAMDLSADAAESGKNTIQGFIDGAQSMLPRVQSAYEEIAKAAIDSIDAKLDIHSPSRVMMQKAEMTWAGFINETEVMRPKLEEAMSSAAESGTDAVSENMQLVALAPQLIAAMTAAGAGAPAAYGTGYSGESTVVQVTFQIQGNASADTVSTLNEYGREFADKVLEVLEEVGANANRRGY